MTTVLSSLLQPRAPLPCKGVYIQYAVTERSVLDVAGRDVEDVELQEVLSYARA